MLRKRAEPDLAFLGVRDLTQCFAEGSLTPVDATLATFDRIEYNSDDINAFSFLDKDGALVSAQEAAKRWSSGNPRSVIDGVPTTIKDTLMVEGWETTFGSLVLGSGKTSEWHSPTAARLAEAGAVLIGQTTTPENGWKGVTDNRRHGVTRNPWDPSKTPGGSSGGAAAAAAMGAGVLHVGTDGGGSVRIPAAFCGIVGHKPTFGRVPAYPPSPYSTLAHVGPMARRVEDVATMLSIMSRPDIRDWHALPFENMDFMSNIAAGVAGKRIAFSPDLGYVDVDPEVATIVSEAVDLFRSLGATVEKTQPPFDDPIALMETLWFAGLAARAETLDEAQLALLDPGLRLLMERGQTISLTEYIRANSERAEFGRTVAEFFTDFDFLVTPTVPMPAFDVDVPPPDKTDGGWSYDWIPFTHPFNLSQHPACSVPCGFTDENLPVGLQIVGPMNHDESVLQAAYAFERASAPFTFPGQTGE